MSKVHLQNTTLGINKKFKVHFALSQRRVKILFNKRLTILIND